MPRITGSKKGGWQLILDWDQKSQNIGANTSTVEARMFLIADKGWNISSTAFTGYININGNTKTISANPSNGGGTIVALGTHTVTVSHNSDGTKSFPIQFSFDLGIYSGLYGGTVGWLTGSGTGSLSRIPRAYTFTAPTTATIGSAFTVNVQNNNSGLVAYLYLSFGTKKFSLGKMKMGDNSVTPPLDKMAPELTNWVQGQGTLTLSTFTSDTATVPIGSTYFEMMFVLPDSVGVSIGTLSASDQNSKVTGMLGSAGPYVQGNSKIKLAIPTTLKYGATLLSTSITAGGKTFSTDTIDLASYDVGTGTVAFKVTVVDSRHFSATKTLNLTIAPYEPPQILSLSIARATGAKATITKTGKVSSIKVGTTEKNTYTAVTEYKVTGTATWGTAKTEENVFANLNLDGFDITKSYDIRVTLTDKLNSIPVMTFLATTSVNLHFHGKDKVGVGKMWERGTLDVGGDIYMNGKLLRDIFYPVGTIYQSTSATNPSIFIGGTWERYGKGKVLVSLDEADTDFATPGKTGGEKNHKLTVAEMPSHDHRSTTNAGYYVYGGESSTSGPAGGQGYRTRLFDSRTDTTGSSSAHNNLQPYVAVYTWRRTA